MPDRVDGVVGTTSHEGLGRRMWSGTLWTAIAQVAPMAVTVFTTPVILGALGTRRFGVIVVFGSILAFCGLGTNGLVATVSRSAAALISAGETPRLGRQIRSITTLGLMLVLLVGGGLFIATPLIVRAVVHTPTLRMQSDFFGRMACATLLLTFVGAICGGILVSNRRYRLVALIASASAVARTVLVAIAVRSGGGLVAVALIGLGGQVVWCLLTGWLTRAYWLAAAPEFAVGEELRKLIRYAAQMTLVTSLGTIDQSSDGILVGASRGSASAAQYGVGANLGGTLRTLPMAALSPLLVEILAAYGTGGRESAAEVFVRLQRTWVRFSTVYSAVALGSIYFGVVAWLGPRFRDAGIFAVLLVLGDTVNLWTGALTSFLSAIDRASVEARYGLIGLAVNLVLTISAFSLGAFAIVAATTVGEIFGSFTLIWLAQGTLRGTERRWFVQEVPWYALMVLVSTAAVQFALHGLYPRGAAGILSAGGVAGIMLALALSVDADIRRRLLCPAWKRVVSFPHRR